MTAKLYFPFGKFSRYSRMYDDEGNYGFKNEKFKNSVLLDGKPVEKKIRFSYSGGEFDADTEIDKLQEDYLIDSFFNADLPVTKYIYRDSAYGTDKNEDRDVQLYWENKNNKTAIYVPGRSSWRSAGDNAGTFGMHLYKDEEIVVYIFGEKPDIPPQVKGYIANGLTVSLQNISEMTFEQFVLEEYTPWDEETGIPLKDWYNIHTDYIVKGLDENRMILNMYMDYITYWDSLLRWYEYDITIPAGETVVNTVAAPLLPDINYEYEPYVYEYTYLLSPAKGWAEFGDIEININTPYYILENSIEGFEKTENGYSYRGNGLPEGELVFELCESDSPKNDIEWAYSIYFLPPFIVCLINIIGFYFLIKNGEKKHKEQPKNEAENEKNN